MMRHFYTYLLVLASLPLYSQAYELSPTFGKRGAVLVDTWPGTEIGYSHVLQPDGKLIVAGTGYWSNVGGYHITMARMDTTCGVLDQTFSNDGLVNIVFEQRTECYSVALQPDGKIIGCGITSTSNSLSQHKPSVYRLNADGSIDTTFNGDGHHKSSFDGTSSGAFWEALLLPDGRITCAGGSISNINGGTQGIGAQRFLADGTLDPSFGTNGIVRISLSGSGYTVLWDHGAGLLQPDGKVIALTILYNGNSGYIGMARFNTNGSLDNTFGIQGLVISTVLVNVTSSNGDHNLDAQLLPNGNILVSAPAPTEGFLMARFLPDGSLDTSYGNGGTSTTVPGTTSVGRGMYLLQDESTLQMGTMHWASGPLAVIKRLPNGALDTTFGNNGLVQAEVPLPISGEQFHDGFMLPSGRIIGYGTWGVGADMVIARFTTDAAGERFVDLGPDTSFCANDTLALDAGPGQTWLWSNGDSIQIAQITTGGTYDVCVTDANGCRDFDEIVITTISAPPVPVITASGLDLTTSANGSLQWFFNGTAIAGADQSTYTALVNGDYTVSVADSIGCSSLSAITAVTTVGINQLNAELIRVFPNPASEQIMIEVPAYSAIKQLALLDATGRTIQLMMNDQGSSDISHIAPGHYTLLLDLQNSQRMSRQLVINR